MNKDSYLILETLPTEYDSRVKAMEVDERPTEQYSDIGGLDKQIQEVRTRDCHVQILSCASMGQHSLFLLMRGLRKLIFQGRINC